MITVNVLRPGGVWKRLVCKGHAEYASPGEDIVCAAVSALVINTANSLEQFTDDDIIIEEDPQSSGYLALEFSKDTVSERASLLMDSLLLGLESIQENYGEAFLMIKRERSQ